MASPERSWTVKYAWKAPMMAAKNVLRRRMIGVGNECE